MLDQRDPLLIRILLENIRPEEKGRAEVDLGLLCDLLHLEQVDGEKDEGGDEDFDEGTFDHDFGGLHDLDVLGRDDMVLHDVVVGRSSETGDR